ncbi:hypothetical protein UCDDS831_g04730 [Diplodia seriata]|uniref:Uncharacterized protein n=2 Tax=Diplodia seriata TaxID=420778 RepID=A0A0G2G9P5_9PEZI|nr:hypothetical protein UCDDS831_g04730 [Diplodia seriata]
MSGRSSAMSGSSSGSSALKPAPLDTPPAPVDVAMVDAAPANDAPPHEPLPSTLHRLPPELRERIYEHALRSHTTIWWPPATPSLSGIATQLLTTSRTIYHEAAPVLYATNRLMFTHPSDANMFAHIFSLEYARLVTSVCLRIRDRDVRLWSAYLSSTSPSRSLAADFPRLKSLWVFYRSNFWSPRAIDIIESFYRWCDDPALREICLNLEERVPADVNIKLVCVHRVPREHINTLTHNLPNEFQVNKGGSGEARTAFRPYDPRMEKSIMVALELTPVEPIMIYN